MDLKEREKVSWLNAKVWKLTFARSVSYKWYLEINSGCRSLYVVQSYALHEMRKGLEFDFQ